jgi:hypothetical protein
MSKNLKIELKLPKIISFFSKNDIHHKLFGYSTIKTPLKSVVSQLVQLLLIINTIDTFFTLQKIFAFLYLVKLCGIFMDRPIRSFGIILSFYCCFCNTKKNCILGEFLDKRNNIFLK